MVKKAFSVTMLSIFFFVTIGNSGYALDTQFGTGENKKSIIGTTQDAILEKKHEIDEEKNIKFEDIYLQKSEQKISEKIKNILQNSSLNSIKKSTQNIQNVTGNSVDNQQLSNSLKYSSGLVILGNSGQSGQVLDIGVSKDIKQALVSQNSLINSGNISSGIQTTNIVPLTGKNSIKIPQLLITEIFFDGNNEWIEIYNPDEDVFSGNISLDGVSKKGIQNLSVEILAQQTIIIGDDLSKINLPISQKYQDKKFLLSDTKELSVKILYSGQILDSFQLTKQQISLLNNKDTSFQKSIDTNKIFPSQTTENIQPPYIASPGKVYTEVEIQNGTQPSTKFSNSSGLYITERYPYDYPYIEITNTSNLSFSGQIVFSGEYNMSLPLQLPPQKSFIYYTDTIPFDNIGFFSGQQIALPQIGANALDLQLWYSGIQLDNFTIHQDWVKKNQSTKTSFEKVGTPNNFTPTFVGLSLDRVWNTKTPYTGNPGKIFLTGENLKNVSQPIVQAQYTGLQLPIDCQEYRNTNTVKISEVFPGNTVYQPYVEVNIVSDPSDYDYLYLSGTVLNKPVYYSDANTLQVNKQYLLTNTIDRYDNGLETRQNPNFQLTNSGWLAVYGVEVNDVDQTLENTLLDIVYVEKFTDDSSVYFNARGVECARIFDKQAKFSPTFDSKLLEFFPIQSDPIIKYIHTSSSSSSCANGEQEVFSHQRNTLLSKIKIKTVKYIDTENQQIIIANNSHEDINLREYRLQFLDPLRTEKILTTTLPKQQERTFTQNFQLPKEDSCINLLYKGEVIDRYCYARLSKLKGDKIEEQNDIPEPNPTLHQNILEMPKLSIINIEYNPKGTDKNQEIIIFDQDISQIFNAQTSKDFSIEIYKNAHLVKKYPLTEQHIASYEKNTIQGDFQFPNTNPSKRDIIVNILYKGQQIANYHYNPYEEKNTFVPGIYKVISVLDGDTVRIDYNGKKQSVRLLGIDAPESSVVRFGHAQCYGKQAKKYLKELLLNKKITFTTDTHALSRDVFKRWLVYANTDSQNINELMIKNGYAKEFTYKNTPYSYQNIFQQAQNQAQNTKLGIRGYECENKKIQEKDKIKDKDKQEEIQLDPESVYLKIKDINYNPQGKDYNRETITIENKGDISVYLDKKFYLQFHGNKKRLPKKMIDMNTFEVLTGNFQFPNTKPTCVDLRYDDMLIDTYCYDPNKQEILENDQIEPESTPKTSQAELLPDKSFEMKIYSLLPNPEGKDKGNEQVTIYLSGDTKKIISPYLQIKDRKFFLNNIDKNLALQMLKGDFGLPNTTACVQLYNGGNHSQLMNTFCYTKPKQGQTIQQNNEVIENLSSQDYTLLKLLKLKRYATKTCLLLDGEQIQCIKTPKIKQYKKKIYKNQNIQTKLYKSFISDIKHTLQSQRYPLYQEEFRYKFLALQTIVENIEKNKKLILNGQVYTKINFQELYNIIHPDSVKKYWEKIINQYTVKKILTWYNREYNNYLLQEETDI